MTTSPILVVVNKYWECDALLAALIGEARPPELGWPEMRWPRQRCNPPRGSEPAPADPDPKPRATFKLKGKTAEVWCISDLLEHLPDEARYQSSSERKAERLPLILSGRAPEMVIAVGTAASVQTAENLNGCVVAGTSVFAHNGDINNDASRWEWTFDTVVASALDAGRFGTATSVAGSLLPRLLPSPRSPTSQRSLVAQRELVSLGDVNVTDYRKYAVCDLETVNAFSAARTDHAAGSIETTHAVIRACLGENFMFVSGIVNRFGQFDADVGGSGYSSAQNFAGAYNAGALVAWMPPRILTE